MRMVDSTLAELEQEAATTRRLERVPNETLDVPLPSIYGPSADENPFG
jgi:hypothetical protein